MESLSIPAVRRWNRREALGSVLLVAPTWLGACGGATDGRIVSGEQQGDGSSTPSAGPMTDVHWALPASLTLAPGPEGAIQLEPYLPAHVRRGGRFSLDPASSDLPDGLTLSPTGTLEASLDIAAVQVPGLILTYQEPVS